MGPKSAPQVIDLGRLRQTCASCGLQQLCLPASMESEDLAQLDSVVAGRRPLERGQTLFRDGMRFGALFVVRSGSFKTWVGDPQGEAQILGFHLPGEIIGFDALSDDVHRCTAEALERSSVCEVPYERMQTIASQVPGLQRQLMRVISREVVRDHEHLVMMGRKQAQERLAIFLSSLADRHRRLRRDPDVLQLTMSRYELANYLGLVVETVSRLFSRFAEQGVLEVERKTVRIRDHAALHALAGEPGADEVCRTG